MELFEREENTVNTVLDALHRLRVKQVGDEYELQTKIKQCFDDTGVGYEKEFRLGPRCRVDFLVHGGIVVEVKRGLNKPNQTRVIGQLERYAEFDVVKALILVVDRNLNLPSEINEKPCVSLGLHKLWGIAL